MDPQLLLVIPIVLAAAGFAGWRFLRQFLRPEDENPACANCPAAKTDSLIFDGPPAPSSVSPPGSAPRD